MSNIILIGLGGFLGVAFLVLVHMGQPGFWATLVVNVTGCFLMGFGVSALPRIWENYPHFVTIFTVGFLGSYTTFSAFGMETVELYAQSPLYAFYNVMVNLVLGLGAVILGRCLGGL